MNPKKKNPKKFISNKGYTWSYTDYLEAKSMLESIKPYLRIREDSGSFDWEVTSVFRYSAKNLVDDLRNGIGEYRAYRKHHPHNPAWIRFCLDVIETVSNRFSSHVLRIDSYELPGPMLVVRDKNLHRHALIVTTLWHSMYNAGHVIVDGNFISRFVIDKRKGGIQTYKVRGFNSRGRPFKSKYLAIAHSKPFVAQTRKAAIAEATKYVTSQVAAAF